MRPERDYASWHSGNQIAPVAKATQFLAFVIDTVIDSKAKKLGRPVQHNLGRSCLRQHYVR